MNGPNSRCERGAETLRLGPVEWPCERAWNGGAPSQGLRGKHGVLPALLTRHITSTADTAELQGVRRPPAWK